MTNYKKKAFEVLEAARPASGFMPSTPEEWRTLQNASIEMGVAMFRDMGMSKFEARKLSNQIYGGAAGLLMLQLSFRESPNE